MTMPLSPRRSLRLPQAPSTIALLYVCSCTLVAAAATSAALQLKERHNVWPAAQVELYSPDRSTTVLQTVELVDFGFEYSGFYEDVLGVLESAKERFHQSVKHLVPYDAAFYPVNPSKKILWPLRGLRVDITSRSTKLKDKVVETYNLNVPPIIDNDAFITLTAPTVYGALRGLQTFLQILEFGWEKGADADVFLVKNAPIQIVDGPVYPYRGLMIDTSRHYLPLSLILHNLNAMEMNKLNVLHWHLTDSQSWPWRTERFPELSDKGAYCDACIYSSNDIRKVIEEAALRGIRVVVEIDLPGHCQSIGKSHPELLCRASEEPLDVTKSEVHDFVHQLYYEIVSVVNDVWLHVGGDEVRLDCWKSSPSIQAWMKEHNITEEKQLLNIFEIDLLKYVTGALGKRPIVWQELYDSGVDLPKETVVDVWKNWDTLAREKASKDGHDILLSAFWYLDHLDEDWRSFYGCDPRAFNGTDEQKAHVVGGHASMWGERVDKTNFMARVWPRAAAMAEKLWTGNKTKAANTAQHRLEKFRCQMIQRGFPASPISPGTCENPKDSMAEGVLIDDNEANISL